MILLILSCILSYLNLFIIYILYKGNERKMYIEYTSDLEKRFISFMKKTVEGIRKDYYRKETRYRRDEILVIDNRYFTISSNNLLYDDIVDLFSTIEFENQKLLQAFNSLTPQQKK